MYTKRILSVYIFLIGTICPIYEKDSNSSRSKLNRMRTRFSGSFVNNTPTLANTVGFLPEERHVLTQELLNRRRAEDATDAQLEHRPHKRTANNNHNLNNPQLLHLSKKTRAVPSSSDTVDEVQEIEIDLFPDLYNSNSCSNFYSREPSLPSSEKLRLAFDTTTMDSTNTGPSSKP
ncbi:hypothetical protein RhiirA5_432227 [Rhizophagus irregularis]|nr:hypothetical protein RhiirA5_432227 [Rhizophagus irregularis]